MKPTDEYAAYQQAYDYLNEKLFGGILPPCLITFQRHRNAYGYFAKHNFTARTNRTLRTDEIALNPDNFAGESDNEVLSTLAHEMAHLFEAHFLKPCRGGYHTRRWAREMCRIGLKPISLDNPGKMTGQRVTHEIIPGGPFDVAVEELLATGFSLRWQSADPRLLMGTDVPAPAVVSTNRSKVTYACPVCDQKAWAKPTARLICGWCQEPMTRRDRG